MMVTLLDYHLDIKKDEETHEDKIFMCWVVCEMFMIVFLMLSSILFMAIRAASSNEYKED